MNDGHCVVCKVYDMKCFVLQQTRLFNKILMSPVVFDIVCLLITCLLLVPDESSVTTF